MKVIYNMGIWAYQIGIRMVAPFHAKARAWVEGRQRIFQRLECALTPGCDVAWFHAASLGEFEQGRPVIEAFRESHPDYKILLTFFSPSGYEIRKNYAGADYVFYLPADTPRAARRFVAIVKPKIVVFIKYEFWLNLLEEVHRSGARLYLISAFFQPNQVFFKSYGRLFRRVLGYFDRLFVQNAASRELLATVGITQVTVAGDTRFDRVSRIAEQAPRIPLLDSFVGISATAKPELHRPRVLVAGSTWPQDETLLLELVNRCPECKFIVAPHEIHPDQIARFIASTTRKCVKYTELTSDTDLSDAGVLFIDTIGILSSVYRYGDFAYIGGGFGAGIHNTLEAATFGLPLAFGPNYDRFQEATDLIEVGGAQSIANFEQLYIWYRELSENPDCYAGAAESCAAYVRQKCGATPKILEYLH